MSKIEKLLMRFYSIPKDLTWDELVKLLNHFGYYELSKKGKSAGSRIKFLNEAKDLIILHKPHPSSIVKRYVIRQIIDKLKA